MDETCNAYGSLCTEVYEHLHPSAPADELNFYRACVRPGMKLLEPMCGSGRFLIPLMEDGCEICGMDRSSQMLERLRQKAPGARAIQGDVTDFETAESFDAVLLPAGSITLLTRQDDLQAALRRFRTLLNPGGVLAFSVDTVASCEPDDEEEKVCASMELPQGETLVYKSRQHYETATQTLFAPGTYELYREGTLMKREVMDFQMHLYRLGEMDEHLRAAGFEQIQVFADFDRKTQADSNSPMLLYVCRAGNGASPKND